MASCVEQYFVSEAVNAVYELQSGGGWLGVHCCKDCWAHVYNSLVRFPRLLIPFTKRCPMLSCLAFVGTLVSRQPLEAPWRKEMFDLFKGSRWTMTFFASVPAVFQEVRPLCRGTWPDTEIMIWLRRLLLVPPWLCPSLRPIPPFCPTQTGATLRMDKLNGCCWCCIAASGWGVLALLQCGQ